MWKDEYGFKHNGPSPYEQRQFAKLQADELLELLNEK